MTISDYLEDEDECEVCGEKYSNCICPKPDLSVPERAFRSIAVYLEEIYINYFNKVSTSTFLEYKHHINVAINLIMNSIHDIYADHVEGLQRQRREDAQRNSNNTQNPQPSPPLSNESDIS